MYMLYKIKKALLKGLLNILGAAPLRVHHFNARWLGWILEHVVKYRVNVVDDNLRHAFPDVDEAGRKKIRHDFYRHFANIFLEALWMGASSAERVHRSHVAELKNPEVLNSMYAQSPSVMIMTSHAGNWELIGSFYLFYYGFQPNYDDMDACVVYRRLHSKVMDDIMREVRTSCVSNPAAFEGYQESTRVVRHIFKNKDRKKVYFFITDQRPYFSAKEFMTVDFMGRRCNTMSASAELAKKFSMAVIYQRMIEREGGYDIEHVLICEDASKMEPEAIIRRFYQLLEEDLRRQPHNYLWTHKRWR